uniref:PH domain-containing protein n=1 Tax=Amphiprion ocellaris TaxID=80972 RepID=A0AAQ5YV81_AMPOC
MRTLRYVYEAAVVLCSGQLTVKFIKKGFQWKEKYLVLTMEGSLLVCRDAESPPDQVVALQTSCETIAEGREILDLPKLPPGGRRDCCFAIVLQQSKFLLLLADNPDDSWVTYNGMSCLLSTVCG